MISLTGLGKLWELAALLPVKLAGIDYDTTNGRAVATDPLGSAVDDNIRTMINRTDDISTSTKRIVDDERNVIVVCHLGNLGEGCDVVLGVSDALYVECLGLFVDCSSKIFGLVAGDKLDGDPVLFQKDLELIIGSTIEIGTIELNRNGLELGGLSTGSGNGGYTTLESSNTLLKDVHSGVANALSGESVQ